MSRPALQLWNNRILICGNRVSTTQSLAKGPNWRQKSSQPTSILAPHVSPKSSKFYAEKLVLSPDRAYEQLPGLSPPTLGKANAQQQQTRPSG